MLYMRLASFLLLPWQSCVRAVLGEGRKHPSEGIAKQFVSLIIVSSFAMQFGSVAEK